MGLCSENETQAQLSIIDRNLAAKVQEIVLAAANIALCRSFLQWRRQSGKAFRCSCSIRDWPQKLTS